MGNLIRSAIKIVAIAAQAVIVSLTAPPPSPKAPLAIVPTPLPIASQPCSQTQEIHVFETENGKVYIYLDSRDIQL